MRSVMRVLVVVWLVCFSVPLIAQDCPTTVAGEPVDCSPPPPTAAPVVFNGDTGPMRVRKSAFELTTAEVAELKLAFQRLREIAKNNPSDPRGWLLQANVHCWYCGGGDDQLSGPEIHGGYFFFPWHRTYLYTLEKILGQLVGNPAFALPYWDWDTPGRDQLPPAYITPNDPSNPLYDARRGATPGLMMPSWTTVSGTPFQKVMAAPTWQLFMGTPNSPDSSMGSLEGGPHGAVHIWTGDPTGNCALSDMGVLATAAQDPIFFAHHANIDRLWSVWLSTQATPPHTNPTNSQGQTDPNWLQQTWTYYDQNQVWYSIAVSDTTDAAGRLHYTYRQPQTPAAAHARHSTDAVASATAKRVTSEPHTVAVSTQPTAAAAPTPIHVLHIDGVILPPGRTASIRVFINAPNAQATSAEDSSFVGQFTIVPHRSAERGHAKKYNLAFHLTPAQVALLGNSPTIPVTLVPMATNGRPHNVSLTYERIYITREGGTAGTQQ